MTPVRTARLAALALAAALALPAGATAATRLIIRGAGFGHGVGMSQYGAFGFAKHGKDYRFILGHYYSGTELTDGASGRVVRVLLQSNRGAASFTGATRAGERRLRPDRTYSVVRYGSARVVLRSPAGRRLGTFDAPLEVTGEQGSVTLLGAAGNGVRDGAYRGALEFRPGLFGGVNAINAAPLEDYLRGVVPAESPASWPIEALKAQAVAARTYALTSNVSGVGFEQYPDTRSQVYRGITAERPSTDAAVAATRGELVTYGGRPVTTFFFSTSGGRTENKEFSFIGSTPNPWLQSVDDPFDDESPKHRWGPYRLTMSQASRKLRGLVKGRFRGIEVVRRGRSPRVVYAEVVGSKGRTRVTGPELRRRFGLFDTWAYFTVISSDPKPEGGPAPPAAAQGPPPGSDPATGGTAPTASSGARRRTAVTGRVFPVRRGATVRLERRGAGLWRAVGTARVRRDGRYRVLASTPGSYRVRYGGVTGAVVVVR